MMMMTTMILSARRAIVLVSVLLLASSSQHRVFSLSANTNNNNLDRRSAIQQAGSVAIAATFGTATASGLLLPNTPVALAADTTINNPIATLADGSKFPLASFGLQ